MAFHETPKKKRPSRIYREKCCDKIYTNRSRHIDHIAWAHEGKTFDCDLCEKIFDCRVNLRNHVFKVHREEKKMKCDFCEMNFFTLALQNNHMKLSHKISREDFRENRTGDEIVIVSKFKCEICTITFSEARIVQEHVKNDHKTEIVYNSDFCKQDFEKIDKLERYECKIQKPVIPSKNTKELPSNFVPSGKNFIEKF